ncbi:hypothetical protein HY312_04365 [Candidatus Saccharibacteria bacterium]|nr:hypothetical protein [Candidatus Saccharibacteria bacterium]
MDGKKVSGMRKRQQITKANQMMFLWVAGASVVVGFAIVISLFLGQRIIFNNKVIAKKNETQSRLESNIAAVPELEKNIRVLNTNEALKSVRLKDDDLAVQSVLDALPADANDTALGSSLQARLISGVSGVTLETMSVEPANNAEQAPAASDDGLFRNNFTFAVSVDANNTDALREVLLRVERSIRAINVSALTVEGQGNKRLLTITGYAYYEPAKTIELKDEVVRP